MGLPDTVLEAWIRRWMLVAAVSAGLLSCALPSPLRAQEEEEPPELPETVVEAQAAPTAQPDPFPTRPLEPQTVIGASRVETPLSQTPQSVTVVTRDEILRSGHSTVAEVLRGRLGVDVVRQGGPGGLTSAFMRGANSQHTKVLLDGIPINDPSNATRGFDFSTLGVENLQRIEVIRGPGSVVHGSDAIGGVINLVTIRGDGPLQIRATSMGGSLGTAEQTFSLSEGDCRHYFSLGGSFLHTDGISAASRRLGATERDRYQLGTLSGRLGWTPADQFNLDYVFRYSDTDAEIDAFDFVTGLPRDAFPGSNLSRAFYNRIQLQSLMLDGVVEQKVGFSISDYNRRDTSPAAFVPRFEGQTREVTYQANVLVSDTNTFTAGAGYLHEEAATAARFAQNDSYVYLEDQQRIADRWFTTAGFRWDRYSSAGPAQTYRFGTIFHVWETGTSFFGTLGTAFRAPALAENLFAFGNPTLRPEQSRGWDLGGEQKFFGGDVVLRGTYFRNDIRDLILFDFNTFLLENIGQARTSGVELETRWQVSPCTWISANYTLTDTLDRDANQPLLRRPRHKAGLTAQHRFLCDRARINAYLYYVGDRRDLRSVVLDEYIVLNLSGSYDISDRWRWFARLDNVTDEQFEEVNGFATPGIAGYSGLRFQW